MTRLVLAGMLILAGVANVWAVSPILSVSPNMVLGDPGETVVFQIMTSAPDDQITGLQFTICYNSQVVSFVSASIGSDLAAEGFSIWNLNPNASADPTCGDKAVIVQLYGGATNWFTGSNLHAATLTFQINQQLCGVSPIGLSEVCARTQFVTFGLETLCYPEVTLQGSTVETTCISDAPPGLGAARAVLEQNVPNPFNPRTNIAFDLPESGPARLQVLTANGRLVRALLDADMPAGRNVVSWDGRDENGRRQPSGVYYYVLSTVQGTLSRQMLLLK